MCAFDVTFASRRNFQKTRRNFQSFLCQGVFLRSRGVFFLRAGFFFEVRYSLSKSTLACRVDFESEYRTRFPDTLRFRGCAGWESKFGVLVRSRGFRLLRFEYSIFRVVVFLDSAFSLCCRDSDVLRLGFSVMLGVSAAEADAAIEALNGKELGDRIIKVTNSRRQGAYTKTPGQYLGPRAVSSKYGDERGGRGEGGGRSGTGGGGAGGGLTREGLRRDSERYRPYDDRRAGGGGARDRFDDRARLPDRHEGGGYARSGYERSEEPRGPPPRSSGYGGGGGDRCFAFHTSHHLS